MATGSPETGIQPARAEVERRLPYARDAVSPLTADPARYPEWLEPLNSIEADPDGTYVADIGYFGQPNEHRMRRIGGDISGLETVAGSRSLLRWTIRIEDDPAGTRAWLTYEKGGSGTVFGASADSPMFTLSIEVLAERSLERLERVLGEANG